VKKILVATDYSKEARYALLFALKMAYRAKAEIILFHAFHQPLSVSHKDHLEETIRDLEKDKTRLLEDYAREIKCDSSKDFMLRFLSYQGTAEKQRKSGNLIRTGYHLLETDYVPEKDAVKIISVCKFGLPADAIQVAAEAYGVNLVIMGMRGAGPVSQAFLGSTVATVIQTGKVPVLALPWQAVLKERPTFVLALDLTAIPDPEMLGWLKKLRRILQAEFKVLHLYQDNDPKQEHQKALVALSALDKGLYNISYEVHFQHRTDICRGIQDFLQAQQADLLALVPKHHTFLEILLGHTVTGLMTEKATVPLLTLPYAPEPARVVTTGRKKMKDPAFQDQFTPSHQA
jgi:nucleotide-binding universal stress UspA family protein